jgi:hypothetical protein
MTTTDDMFEAHKQKAGPDIPPEGLRRAIEYANYFDQEGLGQEKIFSLARELSPKAAPSPLFPFTPGDRIKTGEILKELEPSVRWVRKKMFGREAAPFKTQKEAVTWLEDTVRASRTELTKQQKQEAGELRKRAIELCLKLQAITKMQHGFSSRIPATVAYCRPNSRHVEEVPVPLESPLMPLARGSEQIANATGLMRARVVAYVLTGARPTLPPVTIRIESESVYTLPTGEQCRRNQIVLEVNSPDISDEQLRKIRRKIRSIWKAHRAKPLTKQDEALLRVVKNLGGVPDTGKRQFWKKVVAKCNEMGESFGSFETVKSRHRRLMERLKKRGLNNE